MADLFDRAGNDLGGTFASDGAKIVFSGGGTGLGGGVGLLCQQLQVQYQQQITRLYEIGSNYTFLVAGRTQGSLSVARILGPRTVQMAFYGTYGNVCNAATNNLGILLETGCPKGTSGNPGLVGGLGKLALNIKNVVLTSLGLTLTAQDMIINEALQAMFVSLDASS